MPSVLTVIYWIVCIFIVLGGIVTMVNVSVVNGLIGIVIGLISVRVSFELICVVFSINRNLEKLVALQSGDNFTHEKPVHDKPSYHQSTNMNQDNQE